MSKIKFVVFTAIGGLILLIGFELFKHHDSDGAGLFVDLLYRYLRYIVMGFIIAAIAGAIVWKIMVRKMSVEESMRAEKRFTYVSLLWAAMGFGAAFILGIEKDNFAFLMVPALIIVREVGMFVYFRWDAFVDRHA